MEQTPNILPMIIYAALVSHPDIKQKFVGRNRGEHIGIIGVGIASDVSSTLQVNGGLVYSKTSHGSERGMSINFKYIW
jgi:hypothetical protein